MEEDKVEYTIVPDIDDIEDVYDNLQCEMASIRSELSKTRRAMDINTAVEDCLIPLLSKMDSEGRVDIRPLLSSIAEKNETLRLQAESLTKSLDDRKKKTRMVMRSGRQTAL